MRVVKKQFIDNLGGIAMKFAERLQELRKSNGLSQEQLAEKLNVSRQAVSKWESGQGYPEMEKTLQLCDLFNVGLDYLMRDTIVDGNNSMHGESKNIYKIFVGKLVNIFLKDKEFQGLYQVAVTAVNDRYVLFEEKSKMGVLKIFDIKSISDTDADKRKLEKMQPIITKEMLDDDNPYQQFVGKCCNIRLKCNTLFTTAQGFYHAEISSVTEDGIIVAQKEKMSAIKISDVLMIIES